MESMRDFIGCRVLDLILTSSEICMGRRLMSVDEACIKIINLMNIGAHVCHNISRTHLLSQLDAMLSTTI